MAAAHQQAGPERGVPGRGHARLGLTHAAEREEEKQTLRERIVRLDFDPDDIEAKNEIIEYCFRDCDDCLAVYSGIVDRIDPVAMGYWCEYLKAIARMELGGSPATWRSPDSS